MSGAGEAEPRPVAVILLTLASCTAACQLLWSYDDLKDKPGTTSSNSSSGSSGSTTSSGGCVDPCDCDGDGDNAQTAECDFDGGDCDDHDPQVSSKQTRWFYDAGANGWDYDCNAVVEFEYAGPIQCPLVAPCDGPAQYLGAPPNCGEADAYALCVQDGFGCVAQQQGLMTQGCH